MATSPEELESFHQFAQERLGSGASLDELLMEWCDRRDREEINTAIRRGLSDVERGRFRSADELTETLGQEFGFDVP